MRTTAEFEAGERWSTVSLADIVHNKILRRTFPPAARGIGASRKRYPNHTAAITANRVVAATPVSWPSRSPGSSGRLRGSCRHSREHLSHGPLPSVVQSIHV